MIVENARDLVESIQIAWCPACRNLILSIEFVGGDVRMMDGPFVAEGDGLRRYAEMIIAGCRAAGLVDDEDCIEMLARTRVGIEMAGERWDTPVGEGLQ